jgi:hypothetical protein
MDSREEQELEAIADRLRRVRPAPQAHFVVALRSRLEEIRRPRRAPRGRVRVLIAAYAGSGAFLLAIAALGAAGAGPLAA